MKLSDWAKKQGISYLTAYRWFKGGTLPVTAYQSDSGTIIVQEDPEISEQEMQLSSQVSNDAISLFLKKTVEFSKNNSTIEDFAAYVLSNFSLKVMNIYSDSPAKYSRNKPKSEEVQNYFKQFIPEKKEKPKPNIFVADENALEELVAQSDDLTTQELVGEIQKISGVEISTTEVPEFNDLLKDLTAVVSSNSVIDNSVKLYENLSTEGLVNRDVAFSPQQINYTSSNNQSFGFDNSFKMSELAPTSAVNYCAPSVASMTFIPTQKELIGATKISDTIEKPKRGRPRKK